jgi:hypothetical protein
MLKTNDSSHYLTVIAIIVGIAMSFGSNIIFHSVGEPHGNRYHSKTACEAQGQAELKADTISGYTCLPSTW